MVNIKFFSSIVVLYTLATCCASAQSLSMDEIDSADQCLLTQISTGGVPGLVAVVANKKKIIYKKAFGFNSIANNDTLRTDDIFNIASMTKAVTSVIIMQLFEQGRIVLDSPAQKYLPAVANLKVINSFNPADSSFTVKPPTHPITIRQLLTHTSGIGYAFCNDTLAMISAKTGGGSSYLNYPLLSEPGARWIYGMSTDVLGDIIEAVTDTAIDKYYSEKIFRPLGMQNTFFTVPPEKYSRLANYYQHQDNQYSEHPSDGKNKPVIKGGDGLYSTAEDYTRFLQMLLNNGTFNGVKILDKRTVKQMTTNQVGDLFVEMQQGAIPHISNSFPQRAGKDKYGLGFVIRTATDNAINTRNPGSYDWAGLYNTFYWVDPQAGISAVIMMQVLPFYDQSCIDVLNNFETNLYQHLNKLNVQFSFAGKEY